MLPDAWPMWCGSRGSPLAPVGEKDRQFLRQLRLEFFVHRKLRHPIFEIGKHHQFETLRHWFQALYETLLGSAQGPRMGSFITLYGVENVRKLIAEALAE